MDLTTLRRAHAALALTTVQSEYWYCGSTHAGHRPVAYRATLEEGLKARHLRIRQPEKIRHVTARFQSRESRNPSQIKRS